MIDVKNAGQLLYISSADVSVGDGPGVNESQFIHALHRAVGDRAHFLLPQPAFPLSEDFPVHASTFAQPHRHHHPAHFWRHTLSQMRLADRLIAQRSFDLLLFRLDVLPFAATYLTRRHGIPYATKTLSMTLMWSLSERGGWLGRRLERLNSHLIRNLVAGAIVSDACSQAQVEFFRKRLQVAPEKVAWVDNAVDTSKFYPASTSESRARVGISRFHPIVGYIGARPSERGALHMIESAPRLLQTYPDLGLLIVGDGPGTGSLKRRAEALGIQERCIFAGYVPFDQVPTYCNALDVGVSLNMRPDRYAASELKVRQYIACGKAVVASPGGNEFLEAERLGSIVDEADSAGVLAALDHWLGLTPADREELSLRASRYAAENLSAEVALARRFALWRERSQDRKRQASEM